MRAIAVSCYSDNYSWLLCCDQQKQALVIDACEGAPIIAALERLQLLPAAVCCTHHHADHIGGLPDLLQLWPQLPVYCHSSDRKRIAAATDGLADGDSINFCGQKVEVLHTPGHTMGSLCYYCADYLFTGDTLFGAGCGRVFTGELVQMAASLRRLARLPEKTKVCFGHEYTQANLEFAAFAEPDNRAVAVRKKAVAAMRRQGLSTAPSLLAEELQSNPFLRCDQAEVALLATQRFAALSSEYSDVFAALRRGKDQF